MTQAKPGGSPYVTTGNAARDIDRLRVAMGETKISYIGGSYGPLLGATYSSLFPGRLRAMALDAPMDVDVWVNRPLGAATLQRASASGRSRVAASSRNRSGRTGPSSR